MSLSLETLSGKVTNAIDKGHLLRAWICDAAFKTNAKGQDQCRPTQTHHLSVSYATLTQNDVLVEINQLATDVLETHTLTLCCSTADMHFSNKLQLSEKIEP